MAQAVPLARPVVAQLTFTTPFASSGLQYNAASLVPLFLASQGVHGKVSLKYNEPSCPLEPQDIVKVSLHGSSRIKGPTTDDIFNVQSSFLNLVDVSRIGDTSTSGDEVSVDFSFVFPRAVAFSTRTASDEKQASPCYPLPSSLRLESIIRTDLEGNLYTALGNISYSIRVYVYRQNKRIGFTFKDVRVYNDMERQPPVCLSDFPSDYQCQQQKDMRTRFGKTGISLSASMIEPAPFVFSNLDDFAWTILPITVKAHFSPNKPSTIGTPPVTCDAKVAWRLKTLTFLSPETLTSIPTKVISWRTSPIVMLTTLGPEHLLKCTTAPHQNNDPSSHTWSAALNLPISLEKQTLPSPTLSTPFICRRYSLCVQLKLSLADGQSGKTTVDFEVPVQITYQQGRGDNGLPPEYSMRNVLGLDDDDCNEEPPIYVP